MSHFKFGICQWNGFFKQFNGFFQMATLNFYRTKSFISKFAFVIDIEGPANGKSKNIDGNYKKGANLLISKVEKISEDSLYLIPSPS